MCTPMFLHNIQSSLFPILYGENANTHIAQYKWVSKLIFLLYLQKNIYVVSTLLEEPLWVPTTCTFIKKKEKYQYFSLQECLI